METQFVCRECREVHLDPADAGLGHLVVCVDCALLFDREAVSDAGFGTRSRAAAASCEVDVLAPAAPLAA